MPYRAKTSGAGVYRADSIKYPFKHYFVILKVSLSLFLAALMKGKLQITNRMCGSAFVQYKE